MGYADIYYVPKSKVKDFVTIASVFFKHAAFLEVAVPFTLTCIHDGSIRQIDGIAQSDQRFRKRPWDNINYMYNDRNLVFYHAVKWSKVLRKHKKYRELYCNISQLVYTID